MNGTKSHSEINIPQGATKAKQQETGKHAGIGGFSYKAWMWKVWEFAREDSNRVTFSFKVGLSVLLVSLLILCQAPYAIFGTKIIWSILTVVVMFECTVGATFNRGFNRALGSLLAGILAIAVAQLALCSGRIAEPTIIGISIFLILHLNAGTITSFVRLWPSLVPYEYGFRVILFTYCLIIISGYRMGNPIRTAMDRLYSIAIGGFVGVLVNVLAFPIWSGEQLHNELVSSFNSVADSLEECVKKYLDDDGLNHPEFSKTIMDEFPDEPAYRKCKATLNSSMKLESLANSAKWEPPHGRFQHIFYPWSEYVKVGAVLRYCGYEVMALHGVLHFEIQAPHNLRVAFQSEIQDAATQAAELVRNLGKDISNMKWSLKTSLLKKVHISTERLQHATDMHSYLFISNSEAINNSYKPFLKPSHTHSTTLHDISNQLPELEGNCLVKNSEALNQSASSETIPPGQLVESYHEMMRRQSRRLHSWPSREVDAFEEEGGPRMRTLESTAAQSLDTFASLLIEFVARLDRLVEAVDELSKMAKFKHENS
ncbi:LOW QUALITY PROTEIN: aluminum-activated malate transporter 9 [Manihot esculenta]|uniref:LOW QUALITY PROTEIN: aluminum-activated malate transporter 9 n=1 Tax=Manihot esculenta TaxID=3983 RepID=UPI001CC72BA5|nr:LOW QUALITY PROTEIN: aluminum-activated malate transporter 9 [Manihot esculenta]